MTLLVRMVAVCFLAATFQLPSLAWAAPVDDSFTGASVNFVVDVSGSMDGDPLIQAQAALTTSLTGVADSTAVGLRSFAGDCGDPGLLQVPVGLDNRLELKTAIAALAAEGGTPTPDALRAGVEDLPVGGQRTVVLISDGESSCGPACDVAQQLESTELDFTVFSVGFNAPAEAEEDLSCVAESTGGEYFEATDGGSLGDAIDGAVDEANEEYVALGDSYSAGEGTGDYEPGTDVAGNRCHRSPHAYGPQLDEQLSLGDLTFAACSGAITRDFIRANHANVGEQAQVRNIRGSTDSITFTIGGNDVGFPDVLARCIKTDFNSGGGYGCSAEEGFRTKVRDRIKALRGAERAKTPDGFRIVSVDKVLFRLHRRAPDAFIVVAGYPSLFGERKEFFFSRKGAPSGYACDVGRGATQATIDYDDARWLNGRAAALNDSLRATVRAARQAGVGVRFVDPTDAFGTHRFCGATENWFYPLSIKLTLKKREIVKPRSFHPTVDGQDAYQRAISGLPNF